MAPSLTAPLFAWVPDYEFTLGPEVADVATMAGLTPDPEQRLILDATFATRGGKSAARDIGVVAPRQNLKTGTLKQMALGWLYVTEERLIVWSAHEFGTAQEAFRDMCELIESTPDLDREVKQIHRGNGDEAIELTDDRRLKFKARTKGGGRGLTGNRVVLDEAMYLKGVHMGALVPTLRAVADPQLVFAGSAGMADSHVWRSIRDRGRAGGDPSLAYHEWASDAEPGGCAVEDCTHVYGVDGCALDDVDRLLRSNSAIGRRITLDTLAADRRTMPPDEYARETLGWWDPPADLGLVDLSPQDWEALADGASPRGLPGLFFGLDVSPSHASAAITAGALHPTLGPLLELVERRPGSSWLVDRAVELNGRYSPLSFGVDPAGPIGSLIPTLEAAGIPLTLLDGKTSVRACGALVSAVNDRALHHDGSPEFLAAVTGARQRSVGDGAKWSRKDSSVDIAPLVAATWTHWLIASQAPTDPGVYVI